MFTTLALDRLIESPQNPRRHWNDHALDELATSLRQVGVLTPLLARPVPLDVVEDLGDDWLVMSRATGEVLTVCSSHEQADTWRRNWLESDRAQFEIAAGHRRFRAAQRAGLAEVPVQIRELGDREFLEILTIENLQREDVHPLDEADGYAVLMQADAAYTVEAIAARVGRSVSYVRQRLALRKLESTARDHFLRDEITAAHAVRLARLTPKQQQEALDNVVFLPLLSRAAGEKRLEVAPVSKLDAWIAAHVRLDLHAPETAEQFPEVAAAVASVAVAGATILQLGDHGTKREKGGPLVPGQFRPLHTKKDRCPHAQAGVFVVGYQKGQVVDVCATRSCAKHWPQATTATKGNAPAGKGSPRETQQDRWKREDERRERERKRWASVRPRVEAALVAQTAGVDLTRDIVIGLIGRDATDVVRAMGVASVKALKPSQYAQALQLSVLWHDLWSEDTATKALKAYGIDVKAIAKAADQETKTAEKARAKAAPKATAKGSATGKAKPKKARAKAAPKATAKGSATGKAKPKKAAPARKAVA